MNDDENNPMHPKNLHNTEQSMAWLVDNYPRLWRGLYLRLIEEGFTEPQAMFLLVEYIKTMRGS